MKNMVVNIVFIVLGITLNVLNIDPFWTGMGSSLIVIGCINLLRSYRLNKNEAYREKMEVELSDERNRFIRNKAWAWSGYLFVMIAAVLSIVFRIVGFNHLSIASGFAVLIVIVLFWISYYVLGKKY